MKAFRKDRKLGVVLLSSDIEHMRLFLAIPDTTLDNQIIQIFRAKKYAESLGIKIFVTLVEQP